MANVRAPHQFGRITDQKEFNNSVSRYVDELHPVINGKLQFDQNINSQTITMFFTLANTNYVINHTLNRTGLNFLIAHKTQSFDIFHGSGIDTPSTINLQSSVAGVTVTLILT